MRWTVSIQAHALWRIPARGLFRRDGLRNGLSAIVGCLVLIYLLLGCSRTNESQPLVIGMELAYPPFEMTDERNQPAGVSVDLAHALGEFLNREVRIENIPFDGLIPALKTRAIDLILSSMTATEERAKTVDFSKPYLRTGLCLLVGNESAIQSIGDVDRAGNKVAVKKGTTGHHYAVERIQSAQVLVLDEESAAVLEVSQGKVDAFIYDQMSTYKNWKRHPQTTRAILRPFQEESWAIAIGKGNDGLRDQVNLFLDHFTRQNGFEALGDRYLSEQKQAFEELGIPFYF